jgi:AraC-like DNA-binding protein
MEKGYEQAVWTYHDPEKSRILSFYAGEKKINFAFVHENPGSFAGIGINLSEYPAFFDMSPFSSIHLTLSTENIAECTVTVKLFAPGITDINDATSYRHFGYTFPVSSVKTEYVLPVSGFRDAAWWSRKYNPKRKTFGRNSLKRACFLLIDNSPVDTPPGTESSMTVYSISLYKSHIMFYIAAGAGGYYIVMFAFIFIIKRKRRTRKKEPGRIIEYKKLMVENYRDTDLKKIIAYLRNHYMDPDITLGKMSTECGLSSTRISALVKDEYGITFKQLLNRIRLTEAKRLLQETDRQIIDIAFSLGYNDRSYFYKVFLKSEGISPSEFRKKHI